MTLPSLLWILAAAMLALFWWGQRRSLVGRVPQNPETEAALAEAAASVSGVILEVCRVSVPVVPVWAHGCPCLRVVVPASLAGSSAAALGQARARAAALLEARVRSDPAFGPARSRYVGREGLHWMTGPREA
jgi:hypothetical protein